MNLVPLNVQCLTMFVCLYNAMGMDLRVSLKNEGSHSGLQLINLVPLNVQCLKRFVCLFYAMWIEQRVSFMFKTKKNCILKCSIPYKVEEDIMRATGVGTWCPLNGQCNQS